MGLSNEPQSTVTDTTEQNTLTLGQQANEFLRSAQTDDGGNLILPDDIPNELKELVVTEKKFRDTQSGYTKSRQEVAELKAENEALLAKVGSANISPEDQEALNAIKYEDPDRYFAERTRLENEAKTRGNAQVQDTLNIARQTAQETYRQEELKRRTKILADFQSNTGFQLTEDIINKDVPPRIQDKLKNGMEFGAWLYEVKTYLDTPKRVENEQIDNVTNISQGGSGKGDPKLKTEAYGADTIY